MSRIFQWKQWGLSACPAGERLWAPAGWLALFAFFFACFYLLHGPRITPNPQDPARFDLIAGDEPHYLMLTHSLVADGDLDLFNNMRQQDYRLFYNGSIPDYQGGFAKFWKGLVRGRLKEAPDAYWQTHLFSICSPGLPLLLAPSYAVGLRMENRIRYAVTLFMHALAALTGLAAVWLAWRTVRVRAWALLIGLFLMLSGPLVFYSMSIYTDLPGALCLAGCMVLLGQWPPATESRRWLCLLTLAFLMGFMVWLHTKFWLHFFYVAAMTLWVFHARGRPGRAVYLWLAALLAMAGGIAWYYWLIFGVPYPVRTYPPFELRQALLSGWPGLWLDQRHGLLFYLPAAVFVFPGVVLLARGRDGFGVWLGGLILIHGLATGLFSDWTGGRCPPMRYWTPVIPLMAVPLAACMGAVSKGWFRWLLVLSGVAGVCIGIFGMLHPRRLYAYAHPVFSYHAGAIYKKIAPLFDGDWFLRNTAWVVAALALAFVFSWLALRFHPRTGATHDVE